MIFRPYKRVSGILALLAAHLISETVETVLLAKHRTSDLKIRILSSLIHLIKNI